LGNLNKR